MAEYFIGQVMMTGFGFAPKNFVLCNGQLMAIQQNQALFSLLGVQFGGDGIRTFGLPNLQGRSLYGAGSSVDPSWQPPAEAIGTFDGTETVSLQAANLPMHVHAVNVINNQTGGARAPATNSVLGQAGGGANVYGSPANSPVALDQSTLAKAGGGLPHPNMQPFSVINFNIALSGVFPSRG